MLGVELAAKLCGVPLIDYGAGRGNGVLVSSGAGIMMAIMDSCDHIRWCVDFDDAKSADWEEFLPAIAGRASPVVVAGWFSITSPTPLLRAVDAMPVAPIIYAGHLKLYRIREARSLSDVIRMANENGVIHVE